MAAAVFEVSTSSRAQMMDITAKVREAVRRAGISEGICVVYVPHTTAGVTVNENADPAVAADILEHLEKLVPRGGYRHREGNADSHIKASMMGFSQIIPVESGDLALGTWQGVFLCEFDGPRRRRVRVEVIPVVR
ncbi:MAG: secondary thiamine-phosphate synthase enzyme YjbQ [Actinomycetota bacterium]|nr:secondary thiamine-phosphate synthase enzyme YjbQ [Actinomycetota bacterium]